MFLITTERLGATGRGRKGRASHDGTKIANREDEPNEELWVQSRLTKHGRRETLEENDGLYASGEAR